MTEPLTDPRDCPDASLLRAFVEDSLAPDEAWVADHLSGCTACPPRLDLARQEEALLRAALPIDAPSGLLAGITAAVNADAAATAPAAPARRPRRAERRSSASTPLVAGGLTLLVVVGLAAWRSATRPPAVRPTPTATATPRPAPPSPATAPTETPASVPRAPAPPPSASPANPSPEVVVERPPTPTPIPRPSPTATASPAPTPRATITPTPSPRPTSGVLAAAGRLRAGKLRHGTSTLAAGDAIPAGVELSASAGAAEVDLTDRAALVFNRRARFTLRPSTPTAALRVALARGKLYARTTGRAAYVVETADAVLRPIGTAFLVERTHDRTHLATVDGVVRLRAPPDTLQVRAGFVAVARSGRRLAAPRPWSKPTRALAWLPKRARPAALPQPGRVLRQFEFEQGLAGWGKGQLAQGGARGSRASLRGVRDTGDYATVVEFEETPRGIVTIDPDLWIEVTCRVDRKTTVVLQLWNADRKENLAHFVTLEPNRWTPIAVPLRRFTDARGKPRTTPLQRGDRGTCFNVYAGKAGERVTLRVDDVRFVAPR